VHCAVKSGKISFDVGELSQFTTRQINSQKFSPKTQEFPPGIFDLADSREFEVAFEDSAKATINGLYKVVHWLSIAAKMYDLE